MRQKKIYIPKSISVNYATLDKVIEELDRLGIKPKDYSELEFETDYDSCFYESDMPGVKLNINL